MFNVHLPVVTLLAIRLSKLADAVWYYGGQEWYERKTAEFNAFYPGISVSLAHVAHDAMVNEALSDLEKETNK